MSNAKASPMRSYVPGYELQEPRNLEDALERLAREPGAWKPFAGGTDLMVLLEAGKLSHRKFLSIWKGYKQLAMRDSELIRAIRLPRDKSLSKQFYRKVGTRRAQAISKVCVAAAAHMDAGQIIDVRIALGSVAPTVLRAIETEKVL